MENEKSRKKKDKWSKKKKLIFFGSFAFIFFVLASFSSAALTTWNSSDKNSGITLSNNDMTIDRASGTAWGSIRSTSNFSTGKKYFEYKKEESGYQFIGIGTKNASINSYAGSDNYAWAWWMDWGSVYHNGGTTNLTPTISVNDIVGVAVDFDNGKMWFSKNGVWLASGNPETGANPVVSDTFGNCYIIASNYNTNGRGTLRAATEDLDYDIPNGFESWGEGETVDDIITISEDGYSLADLRVIAMDENETGDIILSGTYEGDNGPPEHVEVRVFSRSDNETVQINDNNWTILSDETIINNTWNGTLNDIPKVNDWLGFEVRWSNNNSITAKSNNRIGVGYVVAYTGQSYIGFWIGYGPYNATTIETPNNLTSKFRHESGFNSGHLPTDTYSNSSYVPYTGWELNSGDGSVIFANKLQEELECPIGVLDYGMGGSALLERYGGAYGYWVGTSASDNWYNKLQIGLNETEPINRRKANAILWYQGYTDCLSDITYQDYYDGMEDLFGYMRNDTNFPSLPIFVVGQPRDTLNSGHSASYNAVRIAQIDICENDNESKNIIAGQAIDQPLYTDGVHLSEAGQESEALRYAQSVLWHEIGTGNFTYHKGPKNLGWLIVNSTTTDMYIEHDGGNDFTPTSGIDSYEVKIGGTWYPSNGSRYSSTRVRLNHTNGTVTDVRCLYGMAPSIENILRDNTDLQLPIQATETSEYTDVDDPTIPQINQTNETGTINGSVMQNDNVTFTINATDNVEVDSVWVTIWQGIIGGPIWLIQQLIDLGSGIWETNITTNSSLDAGDINYTIYVNDTSGNEVNQSGNFTFISTDTCTCPGADSNWEVNMSHYCVLSEACDLGTGTISFVGEGNFTCDARLDTTNMGDPGSGAIFWVNDECEVYVDG